MLEKEFRISELIAGHFRGQLNAEEEKELKIWLEQSARHMDYFTRLHQEEVVSAKLKTFNTAGVAFKNEVWNKALATLGPSFEVAIEENPISIPVKKLWPRYVAAAAAVLLVAAISVLIYTSGITNRSNNLVGLTHNDIAPGKNKAYITLSNGKTIELSSSKKGLVIDADKLTYNDGTAIDALVSGNLPGHSKESGLLTLITPRGGQYEVTLSDGTIVYLNAESSLKYPVAFEGADRTVILQGEAYFEVAKNKLKPFIVTTARQQVQVLGTHFNVSSYADEPIVKTTLLEGSVQVNPVLSSPQGEATSALKQVILKPGQQSALAKGSLKITNADLQANLAWKNGDFIFNDEPLESIMRQISRWYNVEVIYTAEAPKNFSMGGAVSRSRPISAVLERMQGTGKVGFRIEGRKIYVSQ